MVRLARVSLTRHPVRSSARRGSSERHSLAEMANLIYDFDLGWPRHTAYRGRHRRGRSHPQPQQPFRWHTRHGDSLRLSGDRPAALHGRAVARFRCGRPLFRNGRDYLHLDQPGPDPVGLPDANIVASLTWLFAAPPPPPPQPVAYPPPPPPTVPRVRG